MLTNEENIFIMTNMYSELFRLQANLLKVLAQPKRLEIIHLLRDQRLNVTEIYSMLDLPQANVSQHLLALRAAGAAVLATDLVLAGAVNNAFFAVRPPGHHAASDHAVGFCLFNNVAGGVAEPIAHYPLQRVAVLGFDVPHRNRTHSHFPPLPSRPTSKTLHACTVPITTT